MAYADSASDLPMLEAVGLPGGRQPRGQAGRHRPPAGMARRALAQGRRWCPSPSCPSGPVDRRGSRRRGTDQPGRAASGAARRSAVGGGRPMKALVLERNLPRFAASRVASRASGRAGAPASAPSSSSTPSRPSCPATTGSTSGPCCRASAAPTWPPWTGAAPATSRTWSAFPSSPATRWWASSTTGGVDHAGSPLAPGTRAVIEPVLGCAPGTSGRSAPSARPGTPGCAATWPSVTSKPGLQTGFCADTGGGWSTAGLAAHASQLHAVPDGVLRRGRRDGGAHRLCRPRRPVGRHRRRRHGGGDRCRHPRPGRGRRPRPPGPARRPRAR